MIINWQVYLRPGLRRVLHFIRIYLRQVAIKTEKPSGKMSSTIFEKTGKYFVLGKQKRQ
ncbi:hypothetical protein Pmgp_01819 [Pelotomaculum propionicicum]|uniref:Uncharacterized protein n=1 Tax=Pelotomaculum propionicicum TaxID=258475 RepID=A0A4Y7RQK0_9FIRM|nr:hypothetical protein Pmgp_01819 [Pelotomaculum propionicicum]